MATATAHGPLSPQSGVPAPDRVDQLPSRQQNRGATLWVVGAHGGAGETALAGLVSGWRAAEHAWPELATGVRAPVVLTARSNAAGLRRAQGALTQWAAGLVPDVDLIGLVVIADAPGRLPRPLRDLTALVAGGAPRAWTVPWVEAWRLGEPPSLATAPRVLRSITTELQGLVSGAAAHPTHGKELR